jgi:GntR family transcriptional regulator/MocR family aminotransferase
VVDAYAQLTAEGFLSSQPGSGTVVADTGAQQPARAARLGIAAPAARSTTLEIDLRPGPPDLSTFPRGAWAKASRDVLRTVADTELGYTPPWGVDVLREQLSEYLARVRGVMTEPSNILVVTGVTQGITLLVRVLHASGVVDVAVEAPSNSVQRQVLARYGVRVWDVPVDKDGLVVEALTRTPCRAVIVTPGHQYPCGMVMSASRRSALTRWAEERDSVVVEDDYDTVFRYDKRQIGAVQALSPGRVALVGSVSKTLAPGLRLGWLVSPPRLLAELRTAKRDDDFGTSALEQHVLARLMDTGEYDRHVRRLRKHYLRRRDSIVDAIGREMPDAVAEGYSAGLHLLLRLPKNVDENAFVSAAAGRGVAVLGTSPMYGTSASRPGVVIAYGRTSPAMLEEAARRLAVAVAEASRATPLLGSARAERSVEQRRPSTAVDYF